MRSTHACYLAVLILSVTALAAGCGLGGKPRPSATAQFEALVKQGKLAEAEGLCRKTVQSDPKDFEARSKLARVLVLEGDAALREAGFFDKTHSESIDDPKHAKARELFASAVVESEAVLKEQPKLGNVRCTLGLALYRQGRSEQAIEELKRAISDDADLPEAHNTLGIIYYDAGRKDEALACYQQALALRSDLPDANYNVAVLYRGAFQTSRRATDKDTAIKYYQLYLRSGRKEYDAQAKAALAELEGPAEGEKKDAAGGRKG